MAEGGSSGLPVVVKIGGSVAAAERLAGILDCLALAARPLVIVPGGGTYADEVRARQAREGFDDAVAHRLAMQAMHLMAEDVAALHSRCRITDSLAGIADAIAAGALPVFVPLPMLEHDAAMPADWSITSDGIAARLAELIGGAPVILVKSVDVAASTSAGALAAAGVVDAAFPTIVARAGLDWRVIGPSGTAALARFLWAGEAAAGKS